MVESLEVKCSNFDNCSNDRPDIMVPKSFFEDDEVRPELRNTEYEFGYVSPNGWVYCSKGCWINFVEN